MNVIENELVTTPRKKSFFPSFCHSVTITSGCPWHPCKTQHRLLLPNSLTHAPSVSFPPRSGSEDGKHQPPPAKRPRVHCRCRFESKCECFSVVNILSLETCNSISSLCFPEFCGLPQCYHYHLLLFIFTHVTSFVSGPMLPALCLKRLKEEAPFTCLSTLSSHYHFIERKFASSDPWDWISIHKIIVTIMLLR